MGSSVGSLFGGGDDDVPEPNGEVSAAASRNVAIGQDWLNFARESYSKGKDRQKSIDATAGSASDMQLSTAKAANDNYISIMDRYKSLFRPVEDRMVSDANNWDSQSNQDAAAAKAKADVMREADAARGTTVRQMAAYGISPSSGRFDGNNRASNLTAGLASVAAQNGVRDSLKMQGNQMRMNAAQYGLNTTGVAANNASIGTNASSQALSTKLAANTANLQNNNQMNIGFSGAMTGNTSAASILNAEYGNQIAGYNASQGAAAGNMAGIAGLAEAGASIYGAGKKTSAPANG